MLKSLQNRNSILFRAGLIHCVLIAIFILIAFFDNRTIDHLNVWIKPAKFAFSIWLYFWTFAWILYYLPISTSSLKFFSWTITIAMSVEMLGVSLQALRGELSHFNNTTPFNTTIYITMGVFIFINILVVIYITFLFFFSSININKAYLWSIRFGLIMFIASGFFGSTMIVNGTNLIGNSDPGTGLPFLGWSKIIGDIRPAHFLSLHAIQILPFLGYFVSKRFKDNIAVSIIVILGIGLTFSAFTLYFISLSGKPIF